MKYPLLLLATAGLLLLPSCKPPEPPKITATDTGKSGPGGQTIKGGDVSLSFAPDGKPLTFTRGNSTNLLNTKDPGLGFYMTTGAGAEEKTIPFTSLESKDGKLILTADDKTRATLAVNAGRRHISFRLEKLENVPKDSEPVLNFKLNFSNACPEFIPFDYMCITSGKWASLRCFGTASWPYLWKRGDRDPLGGFAFFVPENEDDHNETILRIWTEEKVPHPKVEGEWTYERAKAWVQEWEKTFQDTHILTIGAGKPEELDGLIEYAKKLKVNRLYLHTDTWRGGYWVYDRDSLSVHKAVFPRGEEDLKAFIDKLRANGMDAMLHSLCYGIGPEGSKYMGKGKKTDRRLSNWGKGKLEKPISATDTTILFRPNPGVKFPGPNDYGHWFKFNDVRIGDEIVQCQFEDTDQPVWKLTKCVRGANATNHEAGTEAVGLLKSYNQNYYPDSMTDLAEITAKDYAEFFNRLGVQHHEYDGAESHNDVPWGYPKWAMYVYQNTTRPMTSHNSGGSPNSWDLVYRMISNPGPDGKRHLNLYRPGGGSAALAIDRPGRLATNPIENHFTLAQGAAANSRGFGFGKPEPMFGISLAAIKQYGLSELIADQFAVWREITPLLTQRTDADRGLDAGVFALARLGHAEVERIIHAELRHAGGRQAVGLDHHLRVRGLHRKHHVLEAVGFRDADELEGGLHHPVRRITEAVHDAVGEGAVVRADAERAPEFLGAEDQRREGRVEALQLLGVGRVGVFQHRELLLVGVVAWVHADLLHVFDRLHRRGGQEVDVGHQRLGEARRPELLPDLLERGRRGLVRGRDADDLAARFGQADRLRDRRCDVLRVGGRHRLHSDGVVSAHADAAHVHDAGEAADRAVAGGTGVRGHGFNSTPLPAEVNERQKSQRWEDGTHW